MRAASLRGTALGWYTGAQTWAGKSPPPKYCVLAHFKQNDIGSQHAPAASVLQHQGTGRGRKSCPGLPTPSPLPSVTRSFDKAALPRYGFSLLLLSRSPSNKLLRLQQRLPCPALLTCRSASCLPFTAQPVHSARLADPLGPPVHRAAAPPRAAGTENPRPGGRLLTLSASFCRPPASPRRK